MVFEFRRRIKNGDEKVEKFDCNSMKNEYGLSCIEDYVLFLISQKLPYWPQIFVRSYLTFEYILQLLINGQDYSRFKGIDRLQVIGMQQGICALTIYDVKEFLGIETRNKGTFAIQVAEEYMLDRYKKKLWRDDHFILIRYKENDIYEYMNDYPLDSGVISLNKLNQIYRKKIVKIEIKDDGYISKEQLVEEALEWIDFQRGKITNCTYSFNSITLEQLRDAVGILKVLVKRMEAFMLWVGEMLDLSEYYNYLCKAYMMLEYMRLKNPKNVEILNLIKEIREKDFYYSQKIYKQLQIY